MTLPALCAAFHCSFVNLLGVSTTSAASKALPTWGLMHASATDKDLVCNKQEPAIA